MLDIQQIFQYTQNFGVAEYEMTDDDELWVRGKEFGTHIIIKMMKNKPVLTVWGGDDCQEVLDSTSLPSIETLHAYLDEHARVTSDNQTQTQTKDTSMIDIYINIIKEKLAEQQIALDFENQSPTERLVVRHIENKLAEIIQFLQ
ncbi:MULTISPECIES: hypothetical protein [Moraxella]|uniref:Uncharacterized protein n=1 Tax=Moraxella lacunata TaxID=477 RepID=A0A1B8Q4X7_MORLA|nr:MULTISPECIES: hypothetical protein [Moraxella]MBE9577882.1 hypothetical protein [Moraxella sp. K1664]MBE9587304.1 hypothetical protein [Moraxella sp. K1630]MBE9595544.1 hypothetical protein [Moraxella sp. K2450]MDH9218164.1 hypothetical protein [Moraxella lacunata]MDI4481921.1 hypothetical protein [Moraxella lacunata]